MWIVCNGANKMGSVWLSQVILSTGLSQNPPSTLLDPRWNAPSISDQHIEEAVTLLAASETLYFSKQHWKDQGHIIENSGIIVLNILRDMRDTCVSRYYHDLNRNGEERSIKEYIADRGEALVRARCNYHKHWLDSTIGFSKRYHIACFEQVVQNDVNALTALLDACDIHLNKEEFSRVLKEQKFENKKHGNNMHLRKGKALSFWDDISEKENEYILSLSKKHGLLDVKKRIVDRRPELLETLQTTDIGL